MTQEIAWNRLSCTFSRSMHIVASVDESCEKKEYVRTTKCGEIEASNVKRNSARYAVDSKKEQSMSVCAFSKLTKITYIWGISEKRRLGIEQAFERISALLLIFWIPHSCIDHAQVNSALPGRR